MFQSLCFLLSHEVESVLLLNYRMLSPPLMFTHLSSSWMHSFPIFLAKQEKRRDSRFLLSVVCVTHTHTICSSSTQAAVKAFTVQLSWGWEDRDKESWRGYQCNQHHIYTALLQKKTLYCSQKAKGTHYAEPLWSNHTAKPSVLYLANSKH